MNDQIQVGGTFKRVLSDRNFFKKSPPPQMRSIMMQAKRMLVKREVHITTIALKRQIITDTTGQPIGVILPLEEYALVKDILDEHLHPPEETDKLSQIEKAADDPLFMADLRETMLSFSEIDTELG